MTYLNSADQIGEGGCNTGFLSDFPTITLTGTGLADVTLTLRGRLGDSGMANPRRLGKSELHRDGAAVLSVCVGAPSKGDNAYNHQI